MGEIVKLPKRSTPSPFTRVDLHLYRHNATGTLYIKREFKAERLPNLFKKLTGRNKRAIRAEMEDIVDQHRKLHRGDVSVKQTGRLIGDVIDIFLASDEHLGQREGTRANHRIYIGSKIRKQWGRHSLESVGLLEFQEWIREERKVSRTLTLKDGSTKTFEPRRTFADYAKNMNVLYTFARNHNLTQNQAVFPNPDAKQRKALLNKRERESATGKVLLTAEEREILELQSSRVISTAELQAILAKMDEEHQDQLRCAYMLIMRKRELLQAPWSEIDWESKTWTLPAERVKTGSKTGVGRVVPIPAPVMKILQRRFEKNQGVSRFIFPGWSRTRRGVDKPVNDNKRAWATAKGVAGIQGALRWHDIRHTALTHVIFGDATLPAAQREAMRRDPFKVSKYAGVSLRTIERVYLKTEARHIQDVATALRLEVVNPLTAH